MPYSYTERKRIRKSFAKREDIQKLPNLLETQLNSYDLILHQNVHHRQCKDEGLHAAFTGIFPIESNNGYARLEFESYRLEAPVFDVKECHLRGLTYGSQLYATINLVIMDRDASKPTVKE